MAMPRNLYGLDRVNFFIAAMQAGRALQDPSLKAWHGRDGNRAAGQHAFYHRARLNRAAGVGKYTDHSGHGATVLKGGFTWAQLQPYRLMLVDSCDLLTLIRDSTTATFESVNGTDNVASLIYEHPIST